MLYLVWGARDEDPMSEESRARTRHLAVPLTPAEYLEFMDICLHMGESSSDVPRRLVLEWVDQNKPSGAFDV